MKNLIEILAEKYLSEESDSALMTETDKFKKYGPIVKTFKSSSNPNKTYEVRRLKGQDPTCNCPGWANRKTCKHVVDVEKTVPIAASFLSCVTSRYIIIADDLKNERKAWISSITPDLKKYGFGIDKVTEDNHQNAIVVWTKFKGDKPKNMYNPPLIKYDENGEMYFIGNFHENKPKVKTIEEWSKLAKEYIKNPGYKEAPPIKKFLGIF